MSKFFELSAFLKEFTCCQEGQFQAVARKGHALPMGRYIGKFEHQNGQGRVEQLELCLWRYEAGITIHGYLGDESRFIAALSAWMQDNCPERNALAEPELCIRLGASGGRDLEVTVEFEERLTLVEDTGGVINFRGKRWRLAELEIIPAEAFTLSGSPKPGSTVRPGP